MPRTTKYDDATAKKICTAIKNGNTLGVSALVSGICYDTFNEWRKNKPGFSAMVEEAEAAAQALYVNALTSNAVSGDTKAIIFYLTHRHGDDWKPPKETKVLEGHLGVKVFTDAIMDEV